MRSAPHRDALLAKRAEQFTRLLHAVEDGDVRALHRTRVATRRLRELLPVLQLDADVSDKLGRRLRRATERLGPVRELDVLMLLIGELHESGRYRPEALDRVAAGVERERQAARARLVARLPTTE